MFKCKNIIFIFFSLCIVSVKAQTVTGFVSILQTASALGCGCTGCNDAAFIATQTYPDANGACGTTEPSANSGGCATLSKTHNIVIPTGCTVTVTGCMQDRAAGCVGSTHGPGMDAGDQFSIVGSGGTVNGNSGVQTGASNAQVCATINQVGGQIAFNLTANRVAELLTYTITYSGAGCLPVVLPVEFIDFYVDQTETDLDVVWTTATEHNSRDFEIEFAYDAINFTSLISVPAKGESKSFTRYEKLIPDTFKTDLLYLRLKQNDKDESYTYSPIIYVNSKAESNFKLKPNPTSTGEVEITVNSKVKLPATMEVSDYTGRKIVELPLQIPTTKIDLKNQEKGLYFLHINFEGKSITFKIISN